MNQRTPQCFWQAPPVQVSPAPHTFLHSGRHRPTEENWKISEADNAKLTISWLADGRCSNGCSPIPGLMRLPAAESSRKGLGSGFLYSRKGASDQALSFFNCKDLIRLELSEFCRHPARPEDFE